MGQNSKAKRDLKSKARAKAQRARLGGTLPRVDEHAGHDHAGHDHAGHDHGDHAGHDHGDQAGHEQTSQAEHDDPNEAADDDGQVDEHAGDKPN